MPVQEQIKFSASRSMSAGLLTPLIKGYKCPVFGVEPQSIGHRFSKSTEREEKESPTFKAGKYYKPIKWVVPQNKFSRSSKRKPIFDER